MSITVLVVGGMAMSAELYGALEQSEVKASLERAVYEEVAKLEETDLDRLDRLAKLLIPDPMVMLDAVDVPLIGLPQSYPLVSIGWSMLPPYRNPSKRTLPGRLCDWVII